LDACHDDSGDTVGFAGICARRRARLSTDTHRSRRLLALALALALLNWVDRAR